MTVRSAYSVLFASAFFVVSGCPRPMATLLVEDQSSVTFEESWPSSEPVEPWLPHGHGFYLIGPDSTNSRIAYLAERFDLNAMDVESRMGSRERFSDLEEKSVLIRHDSLLFVARDRAHSFPLGTVGHFTLRERPSLGRKLEVVGGLAALGAGIAILLSNRSSLGETAEDAALGAAISLPFGALLARKDSYSFPTWISGFDDP